MSKSARCLGTADRGNTPRGQSRGTERRQPWLGFRGVATTPSCNTTDIRSFFYQCASTGSPEQHGHPQRLLEYRLALVRNLARPRPADVVLDLGCGNGHHLLALALFLTLAASGFGQDDKTPAEKFEPPVSGQPEEFTGAVGIFRVRASLSATTAQVGQPVLFTLHVAAEQKPGKGAGETVLIVEDEPAMREVTRRILSRSGYNVITASNGLEAIEIAASHPGAIDVLLTDVVMPRMLGKEAADRIRAFRPGVKVLFMSGYIDDALVEEGTSLLRKPFTLQELGLRVREVLDIAEAEV